MKNVLLVIDVQKEYTTEGRPFYIRGIGPSLRAGQKILTHARKNNWKVVHIRHLQEGSIFNPNEQFADFVEGFEPRENESHITKGNFSCFSAPEFTSLMNDYRDANIYVIGYGSGMCCMSTIIDGYHRGFKMNFVADASNAKPKGFDEVTTHAHMTDAITTFANVLQSKDLV
ncbi:MAG: hypothetical protein A2Z20_06265 [Bdellovibrionales bacterium RBG_16_40_8]|nr:MAG: hypothetical protein A2Z20_06265 [Bdellovibrionales bacterium RBG_16_40_8]